MSELRSTLHRGVGGATPPPDGLERMLRRGERKRRNQRITAGVVGLAVFVAAVWFVTTGGPLDRAVTPGGAGTVTGPIDTEASLPPGAAGAGLIDIPPEGATPSTPASGELVLSFFFGHTMGDPDRFHAWLYADGRLIWTRLTSPAPGLVEQRLTPAGVELLRSEVLSTGLFDHDQNLMAAYGLYFGEIHVHDGGRSVRVIWGDCCSPKTSNAPKEMPTPEQASTLQHLDVLIEDPAAWLPASAWEDVEMRPYIPTRYSVCYVADQGFGLDRVLASLPQGAEDLLRSWPRTFEALDQLVGPGLDIWCSDVTTEEARDLVAILGDAHLEPEKGLGALWYRTTPPGEQFPEISIDITPKLPDDVA